MDSEETYSAVTDTANHDTMPRNLDNFRTLEVSNAGLWNLSISTPSSSTPIFYIENSSFTPGKPSVTLTAGTKNGPVLGVVKLACLSQDTIGLGDPTSDTVEMVFEELRKVSKWTHARYEFGCECGGMKERRKFVWLRTGVSLKGFGDQGDWELREILKPGSREIETGEDGELGEVLVIYQASRKIWTRLRGKLFLRKDVYEWKGADELVESKDEDEEWSSWELMVLLSICGLIEGSRRRARSRR